MDLRRLRSFVTVAEQGSVSKAALLLHISQPGLSRQIQELQQELGLPLFERMGRRLVLTAEGEQLLGSCRNLVGQAKSLNEQAQLLKRGDAGPLRVAASSIQIENTLASFLPRYADRYPEVQVKLIESVGAETLAKLERGEIHLAIGLVDAVQADDRHFAIFPVKPLEFMVAWHPSLPLQAGKSVDIGRIAPHPLLLSDTSFSARRKFDAICRLAGLRPNVLIETRSQHAKLALAEAGLGVAVITTSTQTHRYALRAARLTYKRKPIIEPLAVVWNKRRTLPRYALDFCQLLAAHMRTHAGSTQRAPRKASTRRKKSRHQAAPQAPRRTK